jgi:dienelactone hydrolase
MQDGTEVMAILIGLITLGVVGFIWWLLFRYDNGLSGFVTSSAEPIDANETAEGSFSTVHFRAIDGTQLEGWLYRPNSGPAPLVIMAPGLTGTKEGPLDAFARRFVGHGFAVLAFDFRTFGGSAGEPRHWVDPFRHADDYRAALTFARGSLVAQGSVDRDRMALWGSSFSGGTALTVAATDGAVAAVIAQCPFLATSPQLEPKGAAMLKYVVWVSLDLARQFVARHFRVPYQPIYIAAFGKQGEMAFAQSSENPSVCLPDEKGSAFWTQLPTTLRGGWANKMLVRFLADFEKFQPMKSIGDIKCPIYFVAAEHDDMIPVNFVERGMNLAQNKMSRLHIHPVGHFGLYVEPTFTANADQQIAFLLETLGSGPR